MNDEGNPDSWTAKQLAYLEENYGVTSFVEFAKKLAKTPAEVAIKVQQLGLRDSYDQTDDPNLRLQLIIRQLLQEHKRYLPNGWLVGLAMGSLMLGSLASQIEESYTWIEEIEEEINDVLDGIVKAYEFVPLLAVGDMLKGADHGQAYRITGRELVPASRWITYYFTYLYGSNDIPEEYDAEWDDEDDDDDEPMDVILHNN